MLLTSMARICAGESQSHSVLVRISKNQINSLEPMNAMEAFSVEGDITAMLKDMGLSTWLFRGDL